MRLRAQTGQSYSRFQRVGRLCIPESWAFPGLKAMISVDSPTRRR
jgi:hypothetical protein